MFIYQQMIVLMAKQDYLVLSEPNSPHHSASFILHKRTVNGQPALKAVLVFTYHKTDTPGVPTPSPTLPWQQTYVLIKQ